MLDQYSDIMTAAETAEALGVTKAAVYKYIRSGAIRSFRLKTPSGQPSRRVWVPKQSILDLMEVPNGSTD